MKNILPLCLLWLCGCEYVKESVDLVIVNANIYTVDEGFSKAQAFAVHKGKFIAVGTTDEIRDQYTSDQLIDADGRTITPGLIDAHCHFYRLGLNQQVVDLTGTKSYEEVLERVEQFQIENPKDFILGDGWDQNDWENKEYPTRKELDKRFPDIPVALSRVDGHALLVNKVALDSAGIKWNTRIDGGEIVKGPMGITGVLIDNPMQLIDSIIPAPDLQARVEALKDAERICLNHGLTTVNDAGLDRSTIELIDSLQQAGELSIRVYAMVSNTPENVDHFIYQGPIKTDRLNVRSVKVYADGALGSRGATTQKAIYRQVGPLWCDGHARRRHRRPRPAVGDIGISDEYPCHWGLRQCRCAAGLSKCSERRCRPSLESRACPGHRFDGFQVFRKEYHPFRTAYACHERHVLGRGAFGASADERCLRL